MNHKRFLTDLTTRIAEYGGAYSRTGGEEHVGVSSEIQAPMPTSLLHLAEMQSGTEGCAGDTSEEMETGCLRYSAGEAPGWRFSPTCIPEAGQEDQHDRSYLLRSGTVPWKLRGVQEQSSCTQVHSEGPGSGEGYQRKRRRLNSEGEDPMEEGEVPSSGRQSQRGDRSPRRRREKRKRSGSMGAEDQRQPELDDGKPTPDSNSQSGELSDSGSSTSGDSDSDEDHYTVWQNGRWEDIPRESSSTSSSDDEASGYAEEIPKGSLPWDNPGRYEFRPPTRRGADSSTGQDRQYAGTRKVWRGKHTYGYSGYNHYK